MARKPIVLIGTSFAFLCVLFVFTASFANCENDDDLECKGNITKEKTLIDRAGDAMGKCKNYFNETQNGRMPFRSSCWEVSYKYNQDASAIATCFLNAGHENYKARCKECVDVLTEKTWSCNHTSFAKANNSICSVQYQFPAVRPVENNPTQNPTDLNVFQLAGIILGILFAGLFAFELLILLWRLKRGKRKENSNPTEMNSSELKGVAEWPADNRVTIIVDSVLDIVRNKIVINEKWLQIESLPIGGGHFGSVYKGTLKSPDFDTVLEVAVKISRRGNY